MSGQGAYVFQELWSHCEIAISMGVSGPENHLQDMVCLFDGSHSRCKGYQSLGVWVLHPTMHKILSLTSMGSQKRKHP